jgi:hypothetical protein
MLELHLWVSRIFIPDLNEKVLGHCLQASLYLLYNLRVILNELQDSYLAATKLI